MVVVPRADNILYGIVRTYIHKYLQKSADNIRWRDQISAQISGHASRYLVTP
jgi:hypothetical protein